MGRQRQQELWNACKILNIKDENITLVKATLLPDDPAAAWKSQIIAKQILKQVHSLDIDTIITYDRDGVSHHPNHCAIFYSSISIYVANLLQEGIFLFISKLASHFLHFKSDFLNGCLQDAVFLRWIR